jgi:hypothetical protein
MSITLDLAWGYCEGRSSIKVKMNCWDGLASWRLSVVEGSRVLW